MNQFNLINNLANIMLNNKYNLNQKPPLEEQNPLQNQNSVQNNFLNQAQNQILKSTYNQIFEANSLARLSEFQMDNKTVAKYLQNLLEMPDSIVKFIQEASSRDNSTNKLIKVLTQNMVDLDEVALLLNNNSKEAINKVLKTISASISQGNTNVAQLKEVLTALNAIQQTTSMNTNALKELLLLYIPLNIQAFENNYQTGISDDDEKVIANSTLTIIFQTINFGNLTCAVNEIDNSFGVVMYADKMFPSAKFEKIIKAICAKLNIAFDVEFKQRRNSLDKENKIQNFKVFSNSKISVYALLLAHIIIKTTFKFDSSFN